MLLYVIFLFNLYWVVIFDCRLCLSTASNRGMFMRDFGSVFNLYVIEYVKWYFKLVYLWLIYGKLEVCLYRCLFDIIVLVLVSICYFYNVVTSRSVFIGFFVGVECGMFDFWYIFNVFVLLVLYIFNVRIFFFLYVFMMWYVKYVSLVLI